MKTRQSVVEAKITLEKEKLEEKLLVDEMSDEKLDLKSFDIPVKHFMINLSYLQTSRILQRFFYPDEKKQSMAETVGISHCHHGKERLDESAYMSEQLFTQCLYDVNCKYGDDIDTQETMKDILDYSFLNGTKRYIIF